MTRGRMWLVLLATGCACSTLATQHTSSPTEERRPARVLHECDVSAGESHTTVRQEYGPNKEVLGPPRHSSSCSMGASCIAEHGVDTPGDGLVAVECENGKCVCEIEVFGDTSGQSTTRKLAFDARCDDAEQAERLLKERCIPAAQSGAR